jgi:hypothetical protein
MGRTALRMSPGRGQGIDAAARLELTEALLAAGDAAACAARALEWLRRHRAIRSGLCLVAEAETPGRLGTIARVGATGPRGEAFGLDLENSDDPMVRATRFPTSRS